MSKTQAIAEISTARNELAAATIDLAAAERALPDMVADTTVAPASLMAVLGRVRAAQRRVSDLERLHAMKTMGVA